MGSSSPGVSGRIKLFIAGQIFPVAQNYFLKNRVAILSEIARPGLVSESAIDRFWISFVLSAGVEKRHFDLTPDGVECLTPDGDLATCIATGNAFTCTYFFALEHC